MCLSESVTEIADWTIEFILLMPNSPNLTENLSFCLAIYLSVCLFYQYVGITVVLLNLSVCHFIVLPFCLSIILSIILSIRSFCSFFWFDGLTVVVSHPSVYHSIIIYGSIILSTVGLSVFLSLYYSVCHSIYHSVFLSIFLPTISVVLSVVLPFCLSVCPSYHSISIVLSFYLSIVRLLYLF